MFPVSYLLPDEEIDRFRREDCPYGDLTTTLLEIGAMPGRITFVTRDETVVCCTEEARRLFERLGCSVTTAVASGTVVAEGATVFEALGQAGALHMGWKVVLNLLEAASGIAGRTHELLREGRAENPSIEVVATRKVFPGTKAVATKAVYAGRGLPHRLGLSETVLIFAQHLAFLKDEHELEARLAQIKRRAKEKKSGVEVTDERGALAAASVGADIVQIDKLRPEELLGVVRRLRSAAPGVIVAARGGITLQNVRAYAASGVELLVTSVMYWEEPADIGVTVQALHAPPNPGR